MAYIELKSRTSSSLTVYLAGLDSSYNETKRTVKWYVGSTLKKTSTISNGITNTKSSAVTLSGLSSSRSYIVKCVITNIQGMSSGVTLSNSFWTLDPTPNIKSFTVVQTAIGTKKAKCSWSCSSLISGATYEITVSGYTKASGTISASGSVNISFDSFESYTVRLTVYNGDISASDSDVVDIEDYDVTPTSSGGGDYIFSESLIISNRPPAWSWNSSNGSATSTQTQSAYTAVTSRGYTTSFSYLVWNDMVDKVKTIIDCIDETWDSTYATLLNTKLSSTNKKLTANQFNSLKYNIGSHYSTGISDKISGDVVYGSYFVTLANCINSWINTI